jgi:hypothetical protein
MECPECDRLWEDYTDAVVDHLKMVASRHKASLVGHSAFPDDIATREADMASRQIKARRAIDDHEAEHEPIASR